jgi:mRNA-degrading endonuclease toxin of MazEF toxin-antitoxin module
MAIFRGEVYFVELGPTRGRELDGKRRLVVVVSINDINIKPLVITIVPGKTHRPGKPVFIKSEVKVEPTPENGLTAPTVFQSMQIKALDHSRFDRGAVGSLSVAQMSDLEKALRRCLGLDLT